VAQGAAAAMRERGGGDFEGLSALKLFFEFRQFHRCYDEERKKNRKKKKKTNVIFRFFFFFFNVSWHFFFKIKI
jgi:hypothetical protein